MWPKFCFYTTVFILWENIQATPLVTLSVRELAKISLRGIAGGGNCRKKMKERKTGKIRRGDHFSEAQTKTRSNRSRICTKTLKIWHHIGRRLWETRQQGISGKYSKEILSVTSTMRRSFISNYVTTTKNARIVWLVVQYALVLLQKL